MTKMTENVKGNGDGHEKHQSDKQLRPNVNTLLDICSRNVAEFIPFQYIEERYQYRIPGKAKVYTSKSINFILHPK